MKVYSVYLGNTNRDLGIILIFVIFSTSNLVLNISRNMEKEYGGS